MPQLKIIVTAAVILDGANVLIGRRKHDQLLAGHWEFPGGKQETGESLTECLQRELEEELGVNATIHEEIFMEVDHTYERGDIKLVAMLADIGDQLPMSKSHDLLAWAKISELHTFKLAPADLPIAQKIVERFGQ